MRLNFSGTYFELQEARNWQKFGADGFRCCADEEIQQQMKQIKATSLPRMDQEKGWVSMRFNGFQ